jgi:hypothetical protein
MFGALANGGKLAGTAKYLEINSQLFCLKFDTPISAKFSV